MKRFVVSVVAVLLVMTAGVALGAEQKGSRVQAKALVEKAAAYVRAVGKDKAFVEFSNPRGKFVSRDLYVFAIGINGVFLAHGADPSLVGNNQLQSKSEYVRLATLGLIETSRKGGGWYTYQWPHPTSGKLLKKSSFVQKIDDSVFVGCGVYD